MQVPQGVNDSSPNSLGAFMLVLARQARPVENSALLAPLLPEPAAAQSHTLYGVDRVLLTEPAAGIMSPFGTQPTPEPEFTGLPADASPAPMSDAVRNLFWRSGRNPDAPEQSRLEAAPSETAPLELQREPVELLRRTSSQRSMLTEDLQSSNSAANEASTSANGGTTSQGSVSQGPGRRRVRAFRPLPESAAAQAFLAQEISLKRTESAGSVNSSPAIPLAQVMSRTGNAAAPSRFRFRMVGDAPPPLPTPLADTRHPQRAALIVDAGAAGCATMLHDMPATVGKSVLGGLATGLGAAEFLAQPLRVQFPLVGGAVSCGIFSTLSFLRGCRAVLERSNGTTFNRMLQNPNLPYQAARGRLSRRLGAPWMQAFEQWARDPEAPPLDDLLEQAEQIRLPEPIPLDRSAPLATPESGDDGIAALRRAGRATRINTVLGAVLGADAPEALRTGLVLLTHLTQRGGLHEIAHREAIRDARTLETVCKRYPHPEAIDHHEVYRAVLDEHAPYLAPTFLGFR